MEKKAGRASPRPSGEDLSKPLTSVSKIYVNVNEERGPKYSDFDAHQIKWSSTEPYEIVTKIGRGKYSEVFDGFDTRNPKDEKAVVIKVLKPVRPAKIKREIKILQNLKGGPNIVKLLDCVKAETTYSGFMALVFERIDHENVKKLMLTLTPYDCKFYMFQLLKALDFCHSNGIMHRDVKPQNLVIDSKNKRLRLIDWGLADFYHPGKVYNVRVASRHYKSPELLVKMQTYDYSVDLFAFGCTLYGITTAKIPFFRGKDNNDQLFKIAEILGTSDLKRYVKRYRIRLNKTFEPLMSKNTPRLSLSKYIQSRRPGFLTDALANFLDAVLLYDHAERLSAKECMAHEYFDMVRRD